MKSLAEDIVAIQQVLSTYVVALDSLDTSLFAEVFTEDAFIDLPGVGPTAVAAFQQSAQTNLAKLDASHHFLGLPHIRVDGDRAHSRCYLIAQHVLNALAPEPFLMIGAWYTDDLRRTEKGWRITNRVGTAIWFDGNPKVIGADFPNGAAPRGPGHAPPPWMRR